MYNAWKLYVYGDWKLYVYDLIHAVHLQFEKWTLTNGMATYNLRLSVGNAMYTTRSSGDTSVPGNLVGCTFCFTLTTPHGGYFV